MSGDQDRERRIADIADRLQSASQMAGHGLPTSRTRPFVEAAIASATVRIQRLADDELAEELRELLDRDDDGHARWAT